MRDVFQRCTARAALKKSEVNAVSVKLVRRVGSLLLCAAVFALLQIATAPNASAGALLGPDLFTFAVLGSSTVTNVTGHTILTGDLGVSAGSAITGFYGTSENDGPGTFTGAAHQADGFAATGQTQLATAMGDLATLLSVAITIPAGNLNGLTLGPGVYYVPDRAGGNLTGTLTLDGSGGNANGGWVFLMPSRLITGYGSVVDVSTLPLGSGAAVYWSVGSSATLGASSTFEGNILASASITLGDSVTLGCGRALANTGGVTLSTDTIGGSCSGALSSGLELSGGSTGGGVTVNGGVVTVSLGDTGSITGVPEPGTFMLFGAGIACLVARRLRSARG
jgi:type VI secretion system secreted protein VgrG